MRLRQAVLVAEDLDALFLDVGASAKASVCGRAGVVGSVPSISGEVEPNDDGVTGGSIDDLPFANDWSGSFVSSGADRYQAALSGSIASGGDADWDFFKVLASPGDNLVIDFQVRWPGPPRRRELPVVCGPFAQAVSVASA